MILYLSFEELSALGSSAEHALAAFGGEPHGIIAPPQLSDEVELFTHQLAADVPITSLDEQQRMLRVVQHLLAGCRERMDDAVLDLHPAAEEAVAAYFAYAHVLTVTRRLDTIGQEMRAIAELMTGDEAESDAARRFSFPE